MLSNSKYMVTIKTARKNRARNDGAGWLPYMEQGLSLRSRGSSRYIPNCRTVSGLDHGI
jgi:hypothetical protein